MSRDPGRSSRSDYPQGPHDQPQSMCPAFGSLRVGLRMRRTATILSGSACCVYGLTFTSHFYGARRSVGYVPFNSETLVTGKLFEDIREAVFQVAKPGRLRRRRRHQPLRADRLRRAAAPAAEGDRRRPHHRHRRAGLRGSDPCRGQGRAGRRDAEGRPYRGRAGSGRRRPARGRSERPTVALLGEMFPADPVVIGASAGAARPRGRPGGADARMARTLRAPSIAPPWRRSTRSTPPRIREFEAAGRPIVGSAPVGVDGTADWLDRIGEACARRPRHRRGGQEPDPAGHPRGARRQCRSRAGSRSRATRAPNSWSARLLVESGAEVPYVGTACPRTP